MRRMIKRLLSTGIAAIMAISCMSFAAAPVVTAQTVYTQKEIDKCVAKPASVFRDHMVLQRSEKVPVWGYAPDGKSVTVQFNGQTKTTTAKDGEWRVDLDPMQALKTGGDLQVICDNIALQLSDVLVGEVWLAAGQSNMAFIIDYLSGSLKTDILKDCDYNNVRMFYQNERYDVTTPQDETKNGDWHIANKANVGKFSTLGFLLARDLYKELDVPVGILTAAVGGTSIESHINPKTLRDSKLPVNGGTVNDGCVYNAMQSPLTPYKIKGAIWYQGENNAGADAFFQYYDDYTKLLVEQFRSEYETPDMPFIQVQLPSFGLTDFTGIRFAQMEAEKEIPGVYTVVSYDTGNETDIHPADKGPIAERIKNFALAKAYGKTGIDNQYPMAENIELGDGAAFVTFRDADAGLKVDQVAVNSMLICDENGRYYQGKVEIVAANKIKVTADGLGGKVAGIRYGCNAFMKPVQFWSKSGLPVKPFVFEELAPVPDATLNPVLANDYKNFMTFDKCRIGYKYTFNNNYTSYITPEMGGHLPGAVDTKGFKNSKGLPILLSGTTESTEIILAAQSNLKDGSNFFRANELWVWIDTTGVQLEELWFGLKVGGTYGAHFTTRLLSGRDDLAVFLQDGDGWKEQKLNNNGSLENFGNYKGFIRIPTKYIVGQDTAKTPVNTAKVDGFVIGVRAKAADKDKSIEIDNIGFSGPAFESPTGTVQQFIDQMNQPDFMRGDVNHDGKVSGLDALWVLESVAGLRTLDEVALLAANVNEDDKVNGVDALWILEYVASIRPEL